MSEAYVSQIEIFGFAFAPKFWATCSGQILSIQQNEALFALLGTTYGGNGVQTFQLPDLRSRIPVGWGQGTGLSQYDLGQVSGTEAVNLAANQLPMHNHLLNADATTTSGITNTPSSSTTLGRSGGSAPSGAFSVNIYGTTTGSTLNGAAVGGVGGNQAHSNLMPTLGLNFCICMSGIFPSRS